MWEEIAFSHCRSFGSLKKDPTLELVACGFDLILTRLQREGIALDQPIKIKVERNTKELVFIQNKLSKRELFTNWCKEKLVKLKG